MANEPKIYVGSGKKNVEFARKISVCLTDLPKEHIFEYNGKEYIKLEVIDKKDVDRFGKNVSVSVDTWKPDTQATQPASDPFAPADNDLPF